MIKMSGACLILLASVMTSGMLLKEKRKHYSLLAALKRSLAYLSCEIGEKGAPLKGCFETLAFENENEIAGSFFRTLRDEMSGLGEKPFSVIWEDCVRKRLFLLSDQEKEIFLPLGQALGRSNPAALCEALDAADHAIEERITQLENRQGNFRRIAFGIPLSLGAMAVILLI